MSNIQRFGDNTSELERTAEVMQGAIDARVASLLPQVVGDDGSVDWESVRHLPVTLEVGSLVVAKAIPELILDESRITSRLEASGRIEDALNHRNYVHALQAGSAKVLSTINSELFNTEEYRDSILVTTVTSEEGSVKKERVQQASKIMDFSDALLMEMQKVRFDIELDSEVDMYVINPDQLGLFIDDFAIPAAKLARDGVASETAFAIVRVQKVTGVEMDDIFDAANYLSVDINDQNELNKLAYVLATTGSSSDLSQFIDPTTGLFTLLNSSEVELDEIDMQSDEIVLPKRVASSDIHTEDLDPDEYEQREDSEAAGHLHEPTGRTRTTHSDVVDHEEDLVGITELFPSLSGDLEEIDLEGELDEEEADEYFGNETIEPVSFEELEDK